MAKRKSRQHGRTGKLMPVTRETRHVVDLPTGTDAIIIVEQPVPLQQRVPVLRADPHEKPPGS